MLKIAAKRNGSGAAAALRGRQAIPPRRAPSLVPPREPLEKESGVISTSIFHRALRLGQDMNKNSSTTFRLQHVPYLVSGGRVRPYHSFQVRRSYICSDRHSENIDRFLGLMPEQVSAENAPRVFRDKHFGAGMPQAGPF
jgi:hypothetical protein